MEIVSGDDSPNAIKTVHIWSEGDTRLLLDLYAKYLPEIGPLKTFRNKREMWANVSSEIPGKSAKQCEERYKTVLKRKKAAVENNNSTGAKRQKIGFEEELNKICMLDDSIEPEVQMSSQFKVNKEIVEKEVTKKKAHALNKVKTVQETLLEIADKKEEAKERRHKEKLEAVDKMQAIMQNILEDKNK